MGGHGADGREQVITEDDVRNALQAVTRSRRVRDWPIDHDFLKGDMDSLDHATLALQLDEMHGLKIPDQDLPALKSIRAILKYARSRS